VIVGKILFSTEVLVAIPKNILVGAASGQVPGGCDTIEKKKIF
jgi:hypothetical protein